ncbi:MAG: hypothetical protein EXR75_05705 [Myxococcales bacterium]|nr:hypothetical protein [Myxococcales bacterium]
MRVIVRRRAAASTSCADGLAATIHETANALTVVLGWLERARETRDEKALADALRHAESRARWARDELRRGLGAATHVDAPEPADELAHRTVEDLVTEANRTRVTLAVDAAPGSDASVRDPGVAWQILTNLVLNALAASPPDSDVRVAVSRRDEAGIVRFTVSDRGPGIAPERRSELFASRATTRADGSGIGLWHASLLAAEHGGTLALLEGATGARFELAWPAADEAASESVNHERLHDLRILLLEDDAAIIELLEIGLAARGATVEAVRSKEDLEHALRTKEYEVVLLDLSPLGMDTGTAAATELERLVALGRERMPGITVLAISGSALAPVTSTLAWLRKPFSPRELTLAIVAARSRR